jgi:hypothetical protein
MCSIIPVCQLGYTVMANFINSSKRCSRVFSIMHIQTYTHTHIPTDTHTPHTHPPTQTHARTHTLHIYCCYRGKGAPKATVVIIPDEPKETFISGITAISAVSQTMCKTGAATQGIPLYKYIASLQHNEVGRVHAC